MRFGFKAVALAAGLTTAIATVGIVTTTSVASAATSPCGAGFVRVGSDVLKDGNTAGPGRLDIYWNASKKDNCALTVHTGKSVGKAAMTDVELNPAVSVKDSKVDIGMYKSYAGPVTVHSPGCIDVSGTLEIGGKLFSARETKTHCSSGVSSTTSTTVHLICPLATSTGGGNTAKCPPLPRPIDPIKPILPIKPVNPSPPGHVVCPGLSTLNGGVNAGGVSGGGVNSGANPCPPLPVRPIHPICPMAASTGPNSGTITGCPPGPIELKKLAPTKVN